MSERPEDLDAAIAILADQLRGAIEWEIASGGDALPKPAPPSGAAPAPPSESAPPSEAATKLQASSGSRPVEGASQAESPAEPPISLAAAVAQSEPEEPAPKPRVDAEAAIAALRASAEDAPTRLHVLENEIVGDCDRCKLHRGRSNVVFGVGNPEADLVFVGEGPGAEEDRQGVPFVGRAGQLLTKMIVGMGRTRDDVYICNVVKCRPPNNRDPEPDEVDACERFLQAQLAILKPKVIVTLGKPAAHCLLKNKRPISRLRGQWFEYQGIPLMPTFHPAYLLRDESQKRPVWEDLKQVMAKLEELS
jgi:DNA polymerase